MEKLFRLTSLYEFKGKFDKRETDFRIEVFEDTNGGGYRRLRVWAKRDYDIHPTFVNIGEAEAGKIFSSDLLAFDITNLITEDLSLVTGKQISEDQILEEAINCINELS